MPRSCLRDSLPVERIEDSKTEPANAYEALLQKASQDAAFREALLEDPKGTQGIGCIIPAAAHAKGNILHGKPKGKRF